MLFKAILKSLEREKMKEIIKNKLYLVRKKLYRIDKTNIRNLIYFNDFNVRNADTNSFIFSYKETKSFENKDENEINEKSYKAILKIFKSFEKKYTNIFFLFLFNRLCVITI